MEELVRNVEKHLAQYRSNFNKKDASVQWTYPQRRILYVPHRVQQTDYWCGPTSVLQIIDYNGEIGSVAGSTEYQKQNTLAIQSGTTNKGANTLSLRNVLNNYLGNTHTWNTRAITDTSSNYNALWNILYNNIFLERQPVLLLVNAKYLPYYSSSKNVFHYIVVDGMINQIEDSSGQPVKYLTQVRIVDPHYSQNYTGYHQVYFDDIYNAVTGFFKDSSNPQAYNVSY